MINCAFTESDSVTTLNVVLCGTIMAKKFEIKNLLVQKL